MGAVVSNMLMIDAQEKSRTIAEDMVLAVSDGESLR